MTAEARPTINVQSADCVALPTGALYGRKVGDYVLVPKVGRHKAIPVRINVIYDSPPGDWHDWGCHTGCFFAMKGF